MTDADIIQGILAGETGRFQELVDRYQKFVYRTAYAVTGRPADADDVLQEVFLAAYRGLSSLRDRDNVRGWLHGITHFTSQDWLRRHIRSREVERPLGDADHAAPSEAPRGDEEMKQRVLSGLQELPENLRHIIVLKYVDGLSYKEIAALLGVSESAVGERLWRARQHFEKVLAARGVGAEG